MPTHRQIGSMLLAGVLALSVSAAFAQKGARGGGGQLIPQSVLAKLNLNEDQQAKVKAASDAYVADLEKSKALATPKEKRQASRQARATYESSVKGALNPDQQKQLQAIVDQAAEFKGMGPMGMRVAALDLTADQKAKVKEIVAKYEPELQKLRASRKDATDKKAVAAEVKSVTAKMTDEIKTVLTPEQAKELAPAGKRKKNQ